MPRERVGTGEGARFKGLALRGREAGDGGDSGETGEMCDRLTSCTILNKSWTGGLWGPTPIPHKKTHSLWNRHLACSRSWCKIFISSEIVTFFLVARFDSHF
ncbi:hypothetical protein D0A34_19360 [Microcoleus vaginatus PCC 9802]|nr:hypothetical protein MicvaDRAFT_2322 [Microcoleus vaginatus FGP-2]UNU20745.1 hypothetical protein D0A34_19360 [Microcoleus vaginatus PCC 9802]